MQLPDRTLGVNEEIRHTSYDLGQVARHAIGAVLDEGTLGIEVTDLEVKSWGPDASLSRRYSSDDWTSSLFAPGWRFDFESSIDTSTTTYIDETGDSHRFYLIDGSYVAPKGFYATLATSTPEPYRLTFKDRSYLTFDEAGRLTAEGDANGNRVTYDWSAADRLTIGIPEDRSIVVQFAGGKVTSATYATDDGLRTVTYQTPSVWEYETARASVTYFAGTRDSHDVRYWYGRCWDDEGQADYYMTRLDAPYLPSHVSGVSDAGMSFEYLDGTQNQLKMTNWEMVGPGGGAIRYGKDGEQNPMPSGATVQTGGEVISESGWNRTGTYQEFVWQSDGALVRKSNPYALDDPVRDWTYAYSPTGETCSTTSPMSTSTRSVYDLRGNLLSDTDADGNTTRYAYDAAGNCVTEIDPRGSVTSRTFDSAGNILTEERTLDASGATSAKTWDYDEAGHVEREESAISATETAVTTYGAFGPSGEAATTTYVGVKRSYDGSPESLVETRTFDAFGNLLTRSNAAGEREEANEYSPGGRLEKTTDLAGIETETAYDALGRAVATQRSSGSAVVERVEYESNGRDQITKETHFLGGEDAFSISNHIDGLGRTLQTVHSISGTTTYLHDTHGNVVFEWGPDATVPVFLHISELTDEERCQASRKVYDPDGRLTRETARGQLEASSTVIAYSAGGRLEQRTNPDGTWTSYDYDAVGNQTSETRPTTGDGTVSDTSVYDLGGRLIEQTKAVGTPEAATTTHVYDLLDREVSSALGQPATKVYNTLGWVIRERDADGVVTLRDYDAAGRTESESVGGKVTSFAYELGRLHEQTNPAGRKTHYDYDSFGRVTSETQLAGASEIKRTLTAYDALSRAVAATQTAGPAGDVKSVSTYSYAKGATTHSGSTTAYGGQATSVTYDASGRETSRTTSFGAAVNARVVTSRDGEDRPMRWETDGRLSSVAYDAAGKITSQRGFGWASDTTGATYTYDTQGSGLKTDERIDLVGKDGDGDYSAQYSYTEAGRLDEARIGGTNTKYRFDAAGNITAAGSRSFEYDTASNRLLRRKTSGAVDTVFEFDSLGRRTYQGPSGAPHNNTYTWDNDSRLIGYSDTTRKITATFTYDATGQRTSSTVTDGNTNTTTTSAYVYDGITLLSAATTETVDGALSTAATITYLYGETAHPYAAIYTGTGAATPQLFHLTTTDRGDVVQVLSAAGASVATYGYDAWGNPVAARTTSSSDPVASRFARLQPLRYAGYAYDGGTGLYYLSQRYYDAATYQFISKDPAKADGEESAYQYCGGNPVGKVDHTGLAAKSGVLSIHGMVWAGQGMGFYVGAACRYTLYIYLSKAGANAVRVAYGAAYRDVGAMSRRVHVWGRWRTRSTARWRYTTPHAGAAALRRRGSKSAGTLMTVHGTRSMYVEVGIRMVYSGPSRSTAVFKPAASASLYASFRIPL